MDPARPVGQGVVGHIPGIKRRVGEPVRVVTVPLRVGFDGPGPVRPVAGVVAEVSAHPVHKALVITPVVEQAGDSEGEQGIRRLDGLGQDEGVERGTEEAGVAPTTEEGQWANAPL